MARHSASCDVLVVGDGPAGCSTAISVRRLGLTVIVLSRATAPRPVTQSVSPRIAQSLACLQIWDRFRQAGFTPSEGISSSWGALPTFETDYYFQPPGVGWHVDRAHFDQLLRSDAMNRACQFVRCGRLVSVSRQPDRRGWHVICAVPVPRPRLEPAGKCDIRCRFLVDATGRKAATARYVGADRIFVDHQVAVAALCRGPSRDTAGGRLHLEATEWGWWYYAPAGRESSIVVFVTDVDLLPRNADARRKFLAARWNESQVVRSVVEGMPRFDAVQVIPAGSSFLDDNVKSNWAAVGDAALAVDPLSGEGVIRSLEQGIEVAAAVASSLNDDESGVDGFRSSFRTSVTDYLNARRSVFAVETRWPKSRFWRRRHLARLA